MWSKNKNLWHCHARAKETTIAIHHPPWCTGFCLREISWHINSTRMWPMTLMPIGNRWYWGCFTLRKDCCFSGILCTDCIMYIEVLNHMDTMCWMYEQCQANFEVVHGCAAMHWRPFLCDSGCLQNHCRVNRGFQGLKEGWHQRPKVSKGFNHQNPPSFRFLAPCLNLLGVYMHSDNSQQHLWSKHLCHMHYPSLQDNGDSHLMDDDDDDSGGGGDDDDQWST